MLTSGFIIKVIKKYNFKTNVGTFIMNTSGLHVNQKCWKINIACLDPLLKRTLSMIDLN